MEQTKLTKLILEEISGVGDAYGSGPATGLEGWMVRKAAGAPGDSMTWLANLLSLIGTTGGVECDDETRLHYVEKARHALRHDGGQFRQVEPCDLAHGPTIKDAHGFVHSGAVHPRLRAILTGNPRPTST